MRGIKCPRCGCKLKVINPTGVEAEGETGVIVRRRDCRNPKCPAAAEGRIVSLETIESVKVIRYRKRKTRRPKSESSFTGENNTEKVLEVTQKKLLFDG
jgi:hypothetical protein